MRSWYVRHASLGAKLASATVLALLLALPAHAQHRERLPYCPPLPCPAPEMKPPSEVPPRPTEPSPAPAPAPEPSFDFGSGLALGGETVAVSGTGYIDSAIPRTMYRLRFDAAYDNNRPDRAEFFYPKCGCFQTRDAKGPPRPETSVDYQDISSYLEVGLSKRLSGFIEVPVRFLNPEQNDNTNGLADMNLGFKAALIADCDRYVTFQFRTYIPTGDGDRGLGTEHVSLEPGILLYQELTDRLFLEAEFKDWIPIDGSDFAGNVIRYGVGLGYEIYRSCNVRVRPVVEFVGWTVLDGKASDVNGTIFDASGDTIINAKLGTRVYFGENSDIYVGYGRALTGEVWYEDFFRLEYRMAF